MTAPLAPTDVAELIDATKIEALKVSCRTTAAQALAVVRDGVITGEGPTTKGRVHFSRALDAADAAWCERILTATAVDQQAVSRAEIETLFEINDAGAERSDNGRFDDLLAKAVAHHTASASGLPVPPRTVGLSANTAIESWAPKKATGVDTEVLEWVAKQMRGDKRRNSETCSKLKFNFSATWRVRSGGFFPPPFFVCRCRRRGRRCGRGS